MSGNKVALVFGASGVIGLGFIKACLDDSKVFQRIVGVYRTSASAEKSRALLGNPSEEKFISVIGDVASEENALALKSQIEAKAGEITDVVASIGAWGETGPMLSQSLENFQTTCYTQKLTPHFLAAKTFIPLLCDKQDTTYTVINGAAANMIIPNCGNMTVANGALAKFSQVILSEYKDKPIRVNEFMIACFVVPEDKIASGNVSNVANVKTVSNLAMGKALLGVIKHPAASSISMTVTADDLEKLVTSGNI